MDEAVRAKAEDYAGRALALEPGCPQAHVVFGLARGMTNPRLGIAHLKTALAGDPDDPVVLMWLWALYLTLARRDKASPHGERLQRVDPLNPFWTWAGGLAHYFCGEFAACRARMRQAAQAHPDVFMVRFFQGLALAEDRDASASTILEGLAREAPEQGISRVTLALAHALRGDTEAAERALTPDLLAWARHDLEWSLHVAQTYAVLGRSQDSLDWLEHAVDSGFMNFPFLTRDRLLDSVRGTERFERLMERAKREWEAFDA